MKIKVGKKIDVKMKFFAEKRKFHGLGNCTVMTTVEEIIYINILLDLENQNILENIHEIFRNIFYLSKPIFGRIQIIFPGPSIQISPLTSRH